MFLSLADPSRTCDRVFVRCGAEKGRAKNTYSGSETSEGYALAKACGGNSYTNKDAGGYIKKANVRTLGIVGASKR